MYVNIISHAFTHSSGKDPEVTLVKGEGVPLGTNLLALLASTWTLTNSKLPCKTFSITKLLVYYKALPNCPAGSSGVEQII